jgi:hypothetical protein
MVVQAQATVRHEWSAEVVLADFLDDLTAVRYDGWAFLFKNVLHLVPDIQYLFRTAIPRWGDPSKIVVVETISPNASARTWVKQLFSVMGMGYKYHYFVRHSLEDELRASGVSITTAFQIEQRVNVAQWISSLPLNEEQSVAAWHFVTTARQDVRRAMMMSGSGSHLSMLRLQWVGVGAFRSEC